MEKFVPQQWNPKQPLRQNENNLPIEHIEWSEEISLITLRREIKLGNIVWGKTLASGKLGKRHSVF